MQFLQNLNYDGKSTHYSDMIMGAMASQITSLTIVYWTVYSGADQKKYLSDFLHHIHIWHVSPLLNCGDTFQI